MPYFIMPHFPVTVSAEFELKTGKKYQVAVASIANGTILVDKAQAEEGEVVKITTQANSGYRIKEGSLAYYKTENTSEVTPIVGGQFTMPAYAVTVTAEFEDESTPPAAKYAITVATVPNGTLSVNKSEAAEGDAVQITATPSAGYRLKSGTLSVYKTEDNSVVVPVNETQFTMPAYAVTVTAEFEKVDTPPATKYAITVATVSNGTLSVNKSQAAEGDAVQITATPSTGYRLKSGTLSVYKTEDKGILVPVNEMQFTMPAYAVTVTAEFEKDNTPSTAIEDAVFANVVVSPNPFDTQLRILNGDVRGKYALYNTQGVKVALGVLEGAETHISTALLPAGMYLLRLTVENGATKTFTVVKR